MSASIASFWIKGEFCDGFAGEGYDPQPAAGSPCSGGGSVQIYGHASNGVAKNAVVFFHFAYEDPSSTQAIAAARNAVRLCIPNAIVDLSDAALCIAESVESSLQQYQRGVVVIPDIVHLIGGSGNGYAVGAAFASGGL